MKRNLFTRISHQSSTAAGDAPCPAAFSRIVMLDEPTLAPSGASQSAWPPFRAVREVPSVEYDSASLRSKTPLGTAPPRSRDETW